MTEEFEFTLSILCAEKVRQDIQDFERKNDEMLEIYNRNKKYLEEAGLTL